MLQIWSDDQVSVVVAEAATKTSRDVGVVKTVQTAAGYEYCWSYPADAERDEDRKLVSIGGSVVQMLVPVETTSAKDLAQAKRVSSSTSRSDAVAEFVSRTTSEDGFALLFRPKNIFRVRLNLEV